MMHNVHGKRICNKIKRIPYLSSLDASFTKMTNMIHILNFIATVVDKPFIEKQCITIILQQ